MNRTRWANITFCLTTMLSFYGAQGLFFVAASGHLSTDANPLRANGNLLLLAIIPFVIAGIFITPKLARLSVARQIVLLKLIRASVMIAVGIGAVIGFSKTSLIYAAVVLFDLCFYIFQSTSARMSKSLSSSLGVKLVETLSYFGVQAGMAGGALLASLFVKNLHFAPIFFCIGITEFLTIFVVSLYKPGLDPAMPDQTIQVQSPFWLSLVEMRKAAGFANLAAFALLFPVYLCFNLNVGPWAERTFHDSGQMLGWITAAVGSGASAAIFLLMKIPVLRELKVLRTAPLLFSCLCGLLYFTQATVLILSVAFALGFTLAISRIIIRSAFIEVLEERVVGSYSMIGTMFGAILSLCLVSLVSRYQANLQFGFATTCTVAMIQGLLFLKGRRV